MAKGRTTDGKQKQYSVLDKNENAGKRKKSKMTPTSKNSSSTTAINMTTKERDRLSSLAISDIEKKLHTIRSDDEPSDYENFRKRGSQNTTQNSYSSNFGAMGPSAALDRDFDSKKFSVKKSTKKVASHSDKNLFFKPESFHPGKLNSAFKGKFLVKQSEILIRKPRKATKKYID